MLSSENDRTIPFLHAVITPFALSAYHFALLMSAIAASQSVVNVKLQQFHKQKEEAATKVVKRAQYKKRYAFRKCRNEEQAFLTARVEEVLSQAESNLSSITAAPAWPLSKGVKESI